MSPIGAREGYQKQPKSSKTLLSAPGLYCTAPLIVYYVAVIFVSIDRDKITKAPKFLWQCFELLYLKDNI